MRGEFGYWVFEGDTVPAQRPSWNYRKEDGGGIIIDMLCHWRYVLDNLFGNVKAVSCLGATHIPAALGRSRASPTTARPTIRPTPPSNSEGGIIAHFNSSWCVRVRRDDLLTIQVDGTKGTAVAGLRDCWIQPYGATPRPVWNPDVDSPLNYLRRLAEGARAGRPSTTPSRSSGSSSCGTSSKTSPSAGACWKAPKACNSPKKASNPGKSAPGYRSRIYGSRPVAFRARERYRGVMGTSDIPNPRYDQAKRSVQALGPADRLRLIAELVGQLSGELDRQPRRSLLELQGLGKNVWQGVDVDEYLRQERSSWNG